MTDMRMVAEPAPVLAALDKIGRAADDLSEPSRVVLAVGLDEARASAPVRTGELVSTIAIDVTREGGELAARAPYARYQEYGTRFVRARRFMARGRDAIERAAGPTFTKWMDDAVGRATR